MRDTNMNVRDLIVPRRFAPFSGERLRRAAFILSSPRSGSTLLRVMLAGHRALFVPPELRLLSDDCSGSRSPIGVPINQAGAIETMRALFGGDANEHELELSGLAPDVVYGRIQRRIGDRLLIDKTPHYAIDPAILNRAEEMFDGPSYIWLTRHPAGVIESFSELPRQFFWGQQVLSLGIDHDKVAEQTWHLCNSNIEEFVRSIGPRVHTVRYEDLVTDPRAAVGSICGFLGVGWDPAVMSPYDGDVARMTGVPGTGDPRWDERHDIDGSLATSWYGSVDPSGLSTETLELADRLGYDFGPPDR